jgi:hypothetical protein
MHASIVLSVDSVYPDPNHAVSPERSPNPSPHATNRTAMFTESVRFLRKRSSFGRGRIPPLTRSGKL